MNPQKIHATVQEIVQYGTDTYLLRMKPDKSVPRFKPGQFLHLTIDEYDPAGGFWPESRVFSIASSYGDPFVEIVYSVKGVYTNRMQRELAVGSGVWLKLPYGNFIIDTVNNQNKPIVLVAGGTGLSPYLPFLASLYNQHDKQTTVSLYYGVRGNSMVVKRELLQHLADSDRIRLAYFVQNKNPVPFHSAANNSGALNIDAIYGETNENNTAVYYLSGPPGMIKAFRQRLLEYAVPENQIRIDEWE